MNFDHILKMFLHFLFKNAYIKRTRSLWIRVYLYKTKMCHQINFFYLFLLIISTSNLFCYYNKHFCFIFFCQTLTPDLETEETEMEFNFVEDVSPEPEAEDKQEIRVPSPAAEVEDGSEPETVVSIFLCFLIICSFMEMFLSLSWLWPNFRF